MKTRSRRRPRVWQPLGWHPPGAAAFLHALVAADTAALQAWAAATDAPAWCEWLHGQGLAAYAFHQLRATGVLTRLPTELQTALRGRYYTAAGDAELHVRELAAVLDILAGIQITPIVFKGAALAFTVYPDPACRPMGDLDLWLSDEEMPRAQAALEATGYRQYIKEARPVALQAQREGEIQLVGRQAGRGLVELHWGVFAGEWLRRIAAVDRAGLRERAIPVTLAGRPARTLAPEDAIIQLAVHLAVNHQMAYPGVRGLLDVALVAINNNPVDWGAIVERARAWRVAIPTWLVLTLTATLFGLQDAHAASLQLRPSWVRRWLLARFTGPQAILDGRDITRSRLRLLYQLLLVDRPQDAALLVWRALWPEKDWLLARYGAATLKTRIRHLSATALGQV